MGDEMPNVSHKVGKSRKVTDCALNESNPNRISKNKGDTHESVLAFLARLPTSFALNNLELP